MIIKKKLKMKVKVVMATKPSREAKKIIKAFKKNSSRAYEEAKKNNNAYIIEGNWIVRVYADGHKERIKKVKN